ncbi:uncharacterized protein [Ptychodera flava]|uniref:uncharacterized protein n=1 Tax=Ptychodera flava TaxID=63121 RepID=UPI00396A2B25
MEPEKDQEKRRRDFWEERVYAFEGDKRVFNLPNSEEFSRMEVQEFVKALPALEGKVVCDLGAGIGRYTIELARRAKHVTAVELVDGFTQVNKQSHGAMGNIEFITADVVKVDFPPHSFDFIFSNYLLQYLDDKEVGEVVKNVLKWVTVGGCFFVRETYHGFPEYQTKINHEDPVICRPLATYSQIFNDVRLPVDGSDDEFYKFSLMA